jgi:hypothetical protein
MVSYEDYVFAIKRLAELIIVYVLYMRVCLPEQLICHVLTCPLTYLHMGIVFGAVYAPFTLDDDSNLAELYD